MFFKVRFSILLCISFGLLSGPLAAPSLAQTTTDIEDAPPAEPILARNPGLRYGLTNLVENAVDFATTRVEIEVSWSMHRYPSFSAATSNAVEAPDHSEIFPEYLGFQASSQPVASAAATLSVR